MRHLTAEQNAREEGRDCAVEYSGPKSIEGFGDRRDYFRSRIIRLYESGAACSISPAGAPREEFLRLLIEWEQGFDGAVTLLIGAPADRAAAIKQIAVSASALCSLLGVTNILPAQARLGNLRTCAHLADEIAGELSVFFANVDAGAEEGV